MPPFIIIVCLAALSVMPRAGAQADSRWLTAEETGNVVALPPVPANFQKVSYVAAAPLNARAIRASYCDEDVLAAAKKALRDNAPSGWCGRGVYNILSAFDLAGGLTSVNGQEWPRILRDAGWRPVRLSDPKKAPHLSILVYDSDVKRYGYNRRKTRGGSYGHVEIVMRSSLGELWYIADEVRFKPGGSVPDNFTGIAWRPPVSQSLATCFR